METRRLKSILSSGWRCKHNALKKSSGSGSDWSSGVLIRVITGCVCSPRSATPLILMSALDSQLPLFGFTLFTEQLVVKHERRVQSDCSKWRSDSLLTYRKSHTHTQKPLKLHFYISLNVTTETEFTFEARAHSSRQSMGWNSSVLLSRGVKKWRSKKIEARRQKNNRFV